ncbi:hypothetical protein [Vibrio sagamiensis]|uniref:hypothetical protein n=1 Tax=Vibrio sagamiensis TaxID=512650 RepID=UPI001300C391|nr:hypothetical protein [Vibrio sagamiensis]
MKLLIHTFANCGLRVMPLGGSVDKFSARDRKRVNTQTNDGKMVNRYSGIET